jgi:AAA domain
VTWLGGLCLKAYGEFTDLRLDFGEHLTVVYGTNEAGKSTAHDALTDFLWGIPVRSNRASSFARAKLVLEADVHVGSQTIRCVRRATGLVDHAGTPLGPGPWNPDNAFDREWWHARFGIDHRALRAGGSAVLAATQGAHDISDLIFVARRGEVAQAVQEDLISQLETVYVAGARRKSTLRTAWETLEEDKRQLQDKLMRAGDVDQQRSLYEAAERDVRAASTLRTQAQSSLSTARAHARVIDHVLAHVVAEAELAELDEAGPRLDPNELDRYREALARRAKEDQATKAAGENASELQRQIAQLAIDPALLTAGDDIDAVAGELQARLEDHDDLVGTHRPAAERHEAALREFLTQLGVDLSQGVESALQRSRVRVDLARTLDDLAARIEADDQERGTHRANRQSAVARLTDRGTLLDLDISQPLQEADVARAEHELREAQQTLDDEQQALDRLRDEIAEIAEAEDVLPLATTLSRQNLEAVRAARDAVWDDIRQDWTHGPDKSVEERHTLAESFTGLLKNADETGDREAAERESVAARRAVAEDHDGRLHNLGMQVNQHAAKLEDAAARLKSAMDDWADLWVRAGITPAPPIDTANLILGDLSLVHKESAGIRDAEERLQAVMVPWVALAGDAGLPKSATPTTWRARSAMLQNIDRTRTELQSTRAAISGIEQQWEAYRARSLAVLATLEPSRGTPPGPHELATSIRGLHSRLTDQRAQQARAGTLEEQLATQQGAERRSTQRGIDAQQLIDAIRDARQVDDDTLARMGARAEQAEVPIQRIRDAAAAIHTAWPEAVPHEVILSLRGSDKATAEVERQAAQDASEKAQATLDALLEKRATQLILLQQVEGKEGADESLGRVREDEATVAELSGKWLQLRLQVELLKRVIASQGGEDELPLLAEAGEILERFTDGRWVALQPTPGHGARALRIIRADGLEAGPAELSEGTLDQVYLALRLAAVRELHRQRTAEGRPAVPLVLDDVLMAFDVERTKEALALLSELAHDLQIIVFTHHSYVAEQARKVPDVHVAELPAPSPIAADRDAHQVRAASSHSSRMAGADIQPAQAAARSTADMDPSKVRAWAEAEHLMEPGRRGRIPAAILEQYQRALQPS